MYNKIKGDFMKIVFLGDSIRQQYTPRVQELLGNDFKVWQPDENCRFSKYTLRGLFEWANYMEGADIVHWNNGLWDICDLFGYGPFSCEEEYIRNMMQIVDILQKKHKVIIFATTTPVREENRYDKNVTIERFNEIIVPKLKQNGVVINDLNSLLKADVYRYICEDTIHLSADGIELCANQVAECIKDVAKGIDKTLDINSTSSNNKANLDKTGLPVLL